jgi:hypothetical protein
MGGYGVGGWNVPPGGAEPGPDADPNGGADPGPWVAPNDSGTAAGAAHPAVGAASGGAAPGGAAEKSSGRAAMVGVFNRLTVDCGTTSVRVGSGVVDLMMVGSAGGCGGGIAVPH